MTISKVFISKLFKEKVLNLKFWLFVILILFFNIIILYVSLERKKGRFDLLYGKSLPEFAFVDIEGNVIDSNKKLKVLHFTDLNTIDNIQVIRFLEILYQKSLLPD